MRKRGLALLFPPSFHLIAHTLTMWKWDGKYQQVHAYTFTHRHAVRRLSCEYLQDGRLVYIFKTRSESRAALKSPLRALETHSGGLWKTHLFQKCHQSVSLDLWPVESKKKNKSKYYRMWPVLPSRYLTWPHLLWSSRAPACSPHLLKHTQQICLGCGHLIQSAVCVCCSDVLFLPSDPRRHQHLALMRR